MKVGVPTETKADEYRVALTPVGARELAEHGHEVLIQRGAGEGSAISDSDYEAQGARIVSAPEEVWGEADLILGVKEPQPDEVPLLQAQSTLFTYLHLAPAPDLTRELCDTGATCVAYETVEDAQRPIAAPGADERDRRQDRHSGGRVHAREAARGAWHPARWRPGRCLGERDGHRWRGRGHERRLHRDRHGGRRVRLRHQHRSPARARRSLWRPRLDRVLVDALDRGAAPGHRPGDRRRAAARRSRPPRDQAGPASADEEALGARGRRHRSGRLLRELRARPLTRSRPTSSRA